MTAVVMMSLVVGIMLGSSNVAHGLIRISQSEGSATVVPAPDEDCPGTRLVPFIVRNAFMDNEAVWIKETVEAAEQGSNYEVLIFPVDRPIQVELEVAGPDGHCLVEVTAFGGLRARYLVWRSRGGMTRVGFNRSDREESCTVTIPEADQTQFQFTGNVPDCNPTGNTCIFQSGSTTRFPNDPCGPAYTWRVMFGSPTTCLTLNSSPISNIRTSDETTFKCEEGVLTGSTTDATSDPSRTLTFSGITEIACVGIFSCP